jgi:hypothetical protein
MRQILLLVHHFTQMRERNDPDVFSSLYGLSPDKVLELRELYGKPMQGLLCLFDQIIAGASI